MRQSAGLIILIMLIAGAVSLSCNSFGDPVIEVKGTVKDNQGNFVENATVSVQKNENGEIRKEASDQVTKADGVFDFGIVGGMPANAQLVVKKEGFKTFEKEITPSEQVKIRMDVILEPQAR